MTTIVFYERAGTSTERWRRRKQSLVSEAISYIRTVVTSTSWVICGMNPKMLRRPLALLYLLVGLSYTPPLSGSCSCEGCAGPSAQVSKGRTPSPPPGPAGPGLPLSLRVRGGEGGFDGEGGRIEMILGPMFAGKSTELMRRIRRHRLASRRWGPSSHACTCASRASEYRAQVRKRQKETARILHPYVLTPHKNVSVVMRPKQA